MATVILEAHGRAIVVKGDTMTVKDFLKSAGGKWNKPLGGWVFPGSKKASLLDGLKSHGRVATVKDNVGDAQAASSSSKRSADDAETEVSEPQSKKAKTAGTKSATQNSEGEQVFELGNEVRCTISTFAGKVGVDLRKFYTEKGSSELKPTPKGLWLPPTDWDSFSNSLEEINTKSNATSSTDDLQVKVNDEIIFTIRFEGSTVKNVDIRRFYVDKSDGQQKPGKKGITLSLKQWEELKANFSDISTALGNKGVGSSTSSSPKKNKAASVSEVIDAATVKGTRLRKELQTILKGRDLTKVSLKDVRAELEVALKVPDGSLLTRKEEVKGIVTDIIQGQSS